MFKRFGPALAFVAILLLRTSAHGGVLIDTNGTFNLSATNFPSTFGTTSLSLDGTTHSLLGGDLLVGSQVIPAAGNSEWLLFSFSTPNSALAGNINQRWDFTISGVPYNQPVLLKSFIYWYTIDGTALTNLRSWAGGVKYGTDNQEGNGINPINPALGETFGTTLTTPVAPPGPFGLFIQPFGFIDDVNGASTVSFNASDVNGFNLAIQLVPAAAAVPEPSSCAVVGLGALIILPMRRYIRRNSSLPR